MKDNIYIETLKIGTENLETGISYMSLKEKLLKMGFKIEGTFEEYFATWFFSNFYVHNVTRTRTSRVGPDYNVEEYGPNLYIPAILTGEAYQNYIDYLDLKEARENSIRAHRAANKSIMIAMITLIASVAASIISIVISLFYGAH